MGDVHISSNNQSGGITGQNIESNNQSNFTINKAEKRGGRIRPIFWWIFGIVGTIAAVVKIVEYLTK